MGQKTELCRNFLDGKCAFGGKHYCTEGRLGAGFKAQRKART